MKSIAFFASLAAAITAFASTSELEKRQDPICLGVCGVNGAITLGAPVSVSTVISLPIVGPVATISISENFTTTISNTCVGTSCACSPAVDPISTIPVTVALPVTTILTSLGVPLPTTLTLGFTGTLTVPTATVSDVGVSTSSQIVVTWIWISSPSALHSHRRHIDSLSDRELMTDG